MLKTQEIELLSIVRCTRRIIKYKLAVEECGEDASKYRMAVHLLISFIGGILEGKIDPENAAEVIESLDKFVFRDKIDGRIDASGQRNNGNWITINGAHVLINAEGTIVDGPSRLKGMSFSEAKSEGSKEAKGAERKKTYEGTAEHPSATGTNVPCKGFATEYRLYDHASRHGPEFGTKDANAYQQEGIEFLTSAVGGDVLGYMCRDNKIVRFNKETCQYATGYPGKQFCTYMIPKIRKHDLYIDKAKALKYYLDTKEDDL